MAKASVGDSFAEAMGAYESGRPEAARRLAKKLAASHPQFGGAFYLLGLLALDQGQAQQAAYHLDKAVALTPDQPAPRLALASALQAVGKAAEAVTHLQTVLSAHPNHAEAHARLGACWLDLGEDAQAVDHFTQALATHPDWSAVLNNLGLAQGHLGHWAQAVDAGQKAVDISPGHVGFRVNLAMALHKNGQGDRALAEADRAVRDDPANDDGWMALGLIYQTAGQAALAAQAFAHAPHLPSARWSLGEILRQLGQHDQAAEQYRACLQLDPDDRHGARLGLALVTGQPAPARAPEAYVRQLFDDFAADFDRCLVDGLEYRAPVLLGQALAPLLAGRQDYDVVDLGCGTGLAAPVLRPWARRLDGIDLSPAMIEKARARALYDDLQVGDVLAVSGSYDLAVAADVLVYLGDLSMVMTKVAQALRPGGWFAFTVERAGDGDDWVLGAKSRFAHSARYVRQAAAAAGLSVLILDDVSTRSEAGQPVPGLLAVVQHG